MYHDFKISADVLSHRDCLTLLVLIVGVEIMMNTNLSKHAAHQSF